MQRCGNCDFFLCLDVSFVNLGRMLLAQMEIGSVACLGLG